MRRSDLQAMRMHISMCIKKILREDSEACENRFLALLDRVMCIYTIWSTSLHVGKAISQALPGTSQDSSLPSQCDPVVQRLISLLTAAQCDQDTAKVWDWECGDALCMVTSFT